MRLIPGGLGILCCVVACGGETFGTGSDAGSTGGASGSGAVGGNGATGGNGGSGAGSGGPPPECAADDDCKLFSDCCSCEALAKDEASPPSCAKTCVIDQCTSQGVREARCIQGRCSTGRECIPSGAMCEMEPPDCEAGFVPSIRGGCWGPCVPASECERVSGCEQCGPRSACVTTTGGPGVTTRCTPLDPGCNGKASCACLGLRVCGGSCQDTPDGTLECGCRNCP